MYTKETYEKISAPYRKSKTAAKVLIFINRILTVFAYGAYIGFAIDLLTRKDVRLLRFILVPGILFVAVTLFRKVLDKKRPYEVLDIEPIIKKDTEGKSFPSRHAFSMAMVGMAVLYISPPVGILLLIGAAVLAYIRVASGVHFPKDVLVGLLIGICGGVIGFFLI